MILSPAESNMSSAIRASVLLDRSSVWVTTWSITEEVISEMDSFCFCPDSETIWASMLLWYSETTMLAAASRITVNRIRLNILF